MVIEEYVELGVVVTVLLQCVMMNRLVRYVIFLTWNNMLKGSYLSVIIFLLIIPFNSCKNEINDEKELTPSHHFEIPGSTNDVDIAGYIHDYTLSEVDGLDILFDIQSISMCNDSIYTIVSAGEEFFYRIDIINIKTSRVINTIQGDPSTENIFNDIADVACNSKNEILVYSQGFISKFNIESGDLINKEKFAFNGIDMEIDSSGHLYFYSINQQQPDAALDVYQFFTLNPGSFTLKTQRFKETPGISITARKNIHKSYNRIFLHKNFDDKIYEFLEDSLANTIDFQLFNSDMDRSNYLAEIKKLGVDALPNYKHNFLGRFSVTPDYVAAQIDLYGKPTFYMANRSTKNYIYTNNLIENATKLPYFEFPMFTSGNEFCNLVDGEKIMEYKEQLKNLGKSELIPKTFESLDPSKMYLIKMKFKI